MWNLKKMIEIKLFINWKQTHRLRKQIYGYQRGKVRGYKRWGGFEINIHIYRLLREGNGTHSSTLAWKIPWTEEPGRLQSMGSRRVGQDWATSLSLFTFMHWRRKWQPTPVFLPGESQGWGCTESDTTEVT